MQQQGLQFIMAAANDTFLYPTWDYDLPETLVATADRLHQDSEIWQKLVDYVQAKNGNYETIAKPMLLAFLKHEMLKENFVSLEQYMKKASKDKLSAKVKLEPVNFTDDTGRVVDTVTVKAVAPFIVPKEANDIYPIKPNSYHNFRIRGNVYNGKVVGGELTERVEFESSTVTKLVSTGNYRRTIDGCDVMDLKKDGITLFDFVDPATKQRIYIPRKDIDIVQVEILRPYFKFLRFVDQAFALPRDDCNSEERMVLLMENLGRLFLDSKLDVAGKPWRRVEMESKESDKVKTEKYKKDKKTPPPVAKPEQEYDILDIDRERIELDALLWSKREFGNQFKRTDPSVYDLFEALGISKQVTLEVALTRLIGRLTARRAMRDKNVWEPSCYTLYGPKRGRTRMDIWESALVNCLRSTTPDAYVSAIVRHIFLNPTLQSGRRRYSDMDIFRSGELGHLKSSQFESFDHELSENFATHIRANQDSNKYLMILSLPWPETKQHLRKQPERNRYYPEAFVEARFPEIFYVDLKHEHDACERLRRVAYALSLSREKGYPVISRRQVVAPDAFHTDYHTLPLPLIVSSNPRTGVYNGPSRKRKYWAGKDPSLLHEFGRDAKLSEATPPIYTKPISVHPLYPSAMKAAFDT